MTRTKEQLSGGHSKESLLDLAFDKNVNVETSKQIAVGYKSAQQHSSTAAQQHSHKRRKRQLANTRKCSGVVRMTRGEKLLRRGDVSG